MYEMLKINLKWLVAILIATAFSASWAAQPADEVKEKFIGKWDRNAGIISFFVKEVNGIKQTRMLVAEERIEDRYSKLWIPMEKEEFDELEELINDAMQKIESPESEFVPNLTLASKESIIGIGTLIYPNSTLKLFIVNGENQERYASMIINSPKRTFVFWMSKEDLAIIKKLIGKAWSELEKG